MIEASGKLRFTAEPQTCATPISPTTQKELGPEQRPGCKAAGICTFAGDHDDTHTQAPTLPSHHSHQIWGLMSWRTLLE